MWFSSLLSNGFRIFFPTKRGCRSCEIETEINQPLFTVGSSSGICSGCGGPLSPQTVCEVDFDSPLKERKLADLGVPDYDVVKVSGDEGEFFGLLATGGGS